LASEEGVDQGVSITGWPFVVEPGNGRKGVTESGPIEGFDKSGVWIVGEEIRLVPAQLGAHADQPLGGGPLALGGAHQGWEKGKGDGSLEETATVNRARFHDQF
jgi:hypothetical protein